MSSEFELSSHGEVAPSSPANASALSNPNTPPHPTPKKTRKPYTITKQRENWTDEEHQKFIEALKLYDRDWKKIESAIGTKTVIQIRSHAQKYFLKVQKTNSGEKIPPPRPKKKSTSPYPQKFKQETDDLTWAMPENINPSSFAQWMSTNNIISNALSPKRNSEGSQGTPSSPTQSYCSTVSSREADSGLAPNLAKVYSFLGSLFDSSITNHVQILSEMSPTDRESVQILMQNLVLNLSRHQFSGEQTILGPCQLAGKLNQTLSLHSQVTEQHNGEQQSGDGTTQVVMQEAQPHSLSQTSMNTTQSSQAHSPTSQTSSPNGVVVQGGGGPKSLVALGVVPPSVQGGNGHDDDLALSVDSTARALRAMNSVSNCQLSSMDTQNPNGLEPKSTGGRAPEEFLVSPSIF